MEVVTTINLSPTDLATVRSMKPQLIAKFYEYSSPGPCQAQEPNPVVNGYAQDLAKLYNLKELPEEVKKKIDKAISDMGYAGKYGNSKGDCVSCGGILLLSATLGLCFLPSMMIIGQGNKMRYLATLYECLEDETT